MYFIVRLTQEKFSILSPLHNKKHRSVNQISLVWDACLEPTRGICTYMHTYIRIWYTIYNPDIQSIPFTLNKRYTTLISKLQQVRINRTGQPFTKTVLRLDGGQKKPLWGKNTTGNLGSPSNEASQCKQNKYSN